MKVWTDREGKKVTGKEFMQRWAEGVKSVTPIQQVRSQILFSYITIIGLLCGIVVSIMFWSKMWWVFIILLAAIGNTVVGLIGIYQRYTALKNIEEIMKGGLKQLDDEQKRAA